MKGRSTQMIKVKKQGIIDAIKKSKPEIWGPQNQWKDYGLVILDDGKILVNDTSWMPNFSITLDIDDSLEDGIKELIEMVAESENYEVLD